MRLNLSICFRFRNGNGNAKGRNVPEAFKTGGGREGEKKSIAIIKPRQRTRRGLILHSVGEKERQAGKSEICLDWDNYWVTAR